jgi:hypothetical protein
MPDTIMHRDQQDYDQISITNALGGLRLAQLAAGKFSGVDLEAIKDSDIKSIFNSVGSDALGAELTGRIGERFGITSPELTQALLQNQGVAMNPRLEMVFSKKDFRVFQFDFRFQPKSLAESKEIRDIITTFRRYSAPELSKEAGMVGQYYIVPAEFDIEYYSGNTQNEYIGKISSCVLESVDINYSQAGQFAIFDAEGGPPVQIGMTLTFREIDVITREMVDQGF